MVAWAGNRNGNGVCDTPNLPYGARISMVDLTNGWRVKVTEDHSCCVHEAHILTPKTPQTQQY